MNAVLIPLVLCTVFLTLLYYRNFWKFTRRKRNRRIHNHDNQSIRAGYVRQRRVPHRTSRTNQRAPNEEVGNVVRRTIDLSSVEADDNALPSAASDTWQGQDAESMDADESRSDTLSPRRLSFSQTPRRTPTRKDERKVMQSERREKMSQADPTAQRRIKGESSRTNRSQTLAGSFKEVSSATEKKATAKNARIISVDPPFLSMHPKGKTSKVENEPALARHYRTRHAVSRRLLLES